MLILSLENSNMVQISGDIRKKNFHYISNKYTCIVVKARFNNVIHQNQLMYDKCVENRLLRS